MNNYEYLKILNSSVYGTYGNPHYQFDTDLDYNMLTDILKKISNPDISFIKTENIKPMLFIEPKEILTLDPLDLTDLDISYLRNMLLESLRVPARYLGNADPLYTNEYH